MESLIGIAAILTGLIFAGFGAYRLLNVADAIKRLKIESEALCNQAHAEVLQLEARLAALTQTVEELKAAERELTERHKDAMTTLSPEAREKRPAIWIASNRRSKGDIEYRATVSCPRLGGEWSKGRQYVIWARDEDYARRAFEGKFPPLGGFEIGDIRRSREPL